MESFRLEKTFEIILSVTCFKISCGTSRAHAPVGCAPFARRKLSLVARMAVSPRHGPRVGGTAAGAPSLHSGAGSLGRRMLRHPWEGAERCPVSPWLPLPLTKSHWQFCSLHPPTKAKGEGGWILLRLWGFLFLPWWGRCGYPISQKAYFTV